MAKNPSEKEKTQPDRLRISKLSIRNYKPIDKLDLEFPLPVLENDPDITVIGSRNGVGKTSVLEACAWMFLGLPAGSFEWLNYTFETSSFGVYGDVFDFLVRTGQERAKVDCDVQINGNGYKNELEIGRGNITVNFDASFRGRLKEIFYNNKEIYNISPDSTEGPEHVYNLTYYLTSGYYSLIGFSPDPLIIPPVLYFHSNRKMLEGTSEVSDALEGKERRKRRGGSERVPSSYSRFKALFLELMMGKAGLFESITTRSYEKAYHKLDELISKYAGANIGKLRPFANNTFDTLVDLKGGDGSISIDGLSSGQKEIISTLFLIWYYSQFGPLIVLIDEPELHLNVNWHREFVNSLHELAPNNQYIIATHSEQVFHSVLPERRIILQPEEK